MSGGSPIMATSNRRRLVIIGSVVLIFLVFVSFRNSFIGSTSWDKPVIGGAPGVVTHTGNDLGKPPPWEAPAGPAKSSQAAPTAVTSYPEHKEVTAGHGAASHTAAPAAVSTSHPASGDGLADPHCENHAKTSDILVVMKTGATEAYDKLPIHFMTTLRCINASNTVFFSDMEMQMGGHHIQDVLKDVSTEIKDTNPDFELYKLLQKYHDLYEDPRSLKNGGNGWNLDKYKFTHIMLKTWEHSQDADWYLFVEADTYIVWDNLRTLLDKYDASKPYYMGSPTYLDIEFAHGGTGYVISQAAMKKAVGAHSDLAEKYDPDVHSWCCGDRFPGRVLLDEGVKLTKVWPMFNGEKPLTLPYGDNHWCQPILTMHHMTAQEVSQVWTLEQERKKTGIKEPMMIKDIYKHFVQSKLEKMSKPVREDWDNLSTDIRYQPAAGDDDKGLNKGMKFADLSPTERASIEGPEQCEAVCDEQHDCFGWMHKDKECRISHSIKVGGSMSPDNGKRSVSGWNMKVIKKFIALKDDCPDGPDWHVRGI